MFPKFLRTAPGAAPALPSSPRVQATPQPRLPMTSPLPVSRNLMSVLGAQQLPQPMAVAFPAWMNRPRVKGPAAPHPQHLGGLTSSFATSPPRLAPRPLLNLPIFPSVQREIARLRTEALAWRMASGNRQELLRARLPQATQRKPIQLKPPAKSTSAPQPTQLKPPAKPTPTPPTQPSQLKPAPKPTPALPTQPPQPTQLKPTPQPTPALPTQTPAPTLLKSTTPQPAEPGPSKAEPEKVQASAIAPAVVFEKLRLPSDLQMVRRPEPEVLPQVSSDSEGVSYFGQGGGGGQQQQQQQQRRQDQEEKTPEKEEENQDRRVVDPFLEFDWLRARENLFAFSSELREATYGLKEKPGRQLSHEDIKKAPRKVEPGGASQASLSASS